MASKKDDTDARAEKDEEQPSASSAPEASDSSSSSTTKTPLATRPKNPADTLAAGIDLITSFIQDKLKLRSDDAPSRAPKIPPKLSEPTVDALVDYIQSADCKRIITMVGAGISTSAGIPDFRSPGSGLYDNLQKYNLPHPEAIFTIEYFHVDPKPFFSLARELYPGTFKPTKTHYFIRLLAEKGLLLRHYTQNIDTLERIAGIADEHLVEAHGTFHTGHCLGCRRVYTQDWMKERILRDEIPVCEACPGVVKPDIVFFGEDLPQRFWQCVRKDFRQCDLLIVMGSSLVVQPFSELVYKVPRLTPRLLINKERAGFVRDQENARDVAMLGDCDEQCQLLAEKLGWHEELQKLIQDEYQKIDTANKSSSSKM